MRVIDTHVHDVPIPRKIPRLQGLVGPSPTASRVQQVEAAKLADLIEDMDQARVTTSLVVLHEETSEFFRLAAQHPGRLYGLAYYDSLNPHEGLEQVRSLCEDRPGQVLGVATAIPCFGQDPRLRDFVPLYEYCLHRGLPVQFHLGDSSSPKKVTRPMAFGVLATTYPRLKIVCLHAGGGWPSEMPGLLREFPNVFLAMEAPECHGNGGNDAARVLREWLRAVGSHKLMFGSNWLARERRYFQRVEMMRRLPWWQRANVCWRTAVRVYGPQLRSGQLSAVSHQHEKS